MAMQGLTKNAGVSGTAAALLGAFALLFPAAPSAQLAKLPSCSQLKTVITPVIKRAVSITGNVIGQGDLGASVTCNFGANLSVEIQPTVGAGVFNNDQATTAKAKKLTGLGKKAFTALLSIPTGKSKISYYEVEVLQGTAVLKVISTAAPLATDLTLARKLLPSM
jgi:hypothetical protein